MRPPRPRHAPLPLLVWLLSACAGAHPIVVGSKNFTESIILGEIVAQALEHEGFRVERKPNLGGTFVCHEAIRAGQIDIYMEYTGTASSAILQLETSRDRDAVYRTVDSLYRARWDLEWTEPLGFENTFAMLIRAADAKRLAITNLSQAARYSPQWRAGFGYEFIERADGYRGLSAAYGLRFRGEPAVMDLGLTYRALAEGRVDIIAGNSTDGQIAALDLFQLGDDKHYFPPYDAAPVVRRELLARFPEVRAVLRRLGGRIDEATMRRMNYEVDVAKRDVREVARGFLTSVVLPTPPAAHRLAMGYLYRTVTHPASTPGQ